MSKPLKSVVMRLTQVEAAKFRYRRHFDKAWAKEQARQEAALVPLCAALNAVAAQAGYTGAKCEVTA